MLVRDAMTPHPRSANAETSVREVVRILAESDIRHLPIIRGSALVGIVSTRDLRAVVPSGVAYFGDPHEIQQILDQPVGELMNNTPISVNPGSELREAVDLMLGHKIGAVTVIEPGSQELVGIVTYVDALRVARPFL